MAKKLKIAFVLTQSLESPSGLGRFGPIARELTRNGHNVEIFCLHPDWRNLENKVYIDKGVKINYVSHMHIRKIRSHKYYFSSQKLIWISLLAIFRLSRAIWRSQAEIIQICKPHPINILAALLAKRGRPIYCDCDDYEAETNVFSSRWQRPIVQYFENGIINIATGITVNTHFNLERYAKLGYSRQNIIFVPNGVERDRFDQIIDTTDVIQQLSINPEAPLIVYIGTLGVKSHPLGLLLEAFSVVVDQIPHSRLLLVGGGEDYDTLISQAQCLGVFDKTLFVGHQPPEEIPRYLAIATVSVDPIRDDLVAKARYPLKIVESIALGIPVVTGDVGDRRLILQDGKLGVLVNPGDSCALADGILELLRDPSRREHMSRAAKDHKTKLYWENIAKDFVKIYSNSMYHN
ncbi:glycosyltransferase family 4 protein [Chloroflexota bacterium]